MSKTFITQLPDEVRDVIVEEFLNCVESLLNKFELSGTDFGPVSILNALLAINLSTLQTLIPEEAFAEYITELYLLHSKPNARN